MRSASCFHRGVEPSFDGSPDDISDSGGFVRLFPWLQAALTILMILLMVNLAFGASIYAFWKHKKSRFAIATITVLGLGVPSLVLGIWAIAGPSRFSQGDPPLPLLKS